MYLGQVFSYPHKFCGQTGIRFHRFGQTIDRLTPSSYRSSRRIRSGSPHVPEHDLLIPLPDPSPTAVASYVFPAVTGYPKDANGYHSYGVVLDPPFVAIACEKYWIAIQAEFDFPPQWGWANTDGITLSPAVQGFPALGTQFWTMIDPEVDMAFYLTAEGPDPVPAICCDPGIMTWKVKPGVPVHGTFHVTNCGDDGSTLTWQVDTWPAWMTAVVFTPPGGNIPKPGPGTDVDFDFTAPTAQDTYSGVIKVINVDDPTDFCEMPVECIVPRTKGVFFNIFEYLVNQFPMLKALFGL